MGMGEIKNLQQQSTSGDSYTTSKLEPCHTMATQSQRSGAAVACAASDGMEK